MGISEKILIQKIGLKNFNQIMDVENQVKWTIKFEIGKYVKNIKSW